jgi:hypothetical protein
MQSGVKLSPAFSRTSSPAGHQTSVPTTTTVESAPLRFRGSPSISPLLTAGRCQSGILGHLKSCELRITSCENQVNSKLAPQNAPFFCRNCATTSATFKVAPLRAGSLTTERRPEQAVRSSGIDNALAPELALLVPAYGCAAAARSVLGPIVHGPIVPLGARLKTRSRPRRRPPEGPWGKLGPLGRNSRILKMILGPLGEEKLTESKGEGSGVRGHRSVLNGRKLIAESHWRSGNEKSLSRPKTKA